MTTVADYAALIQRAAVVDRSDRGRLRFVGPKAAEVLNGLVTNDVLALKPGTGQYAAALTAKGKVVADLRIFREADSILVDCPARAWDGWWSLVRKFVNPRLCAYRDERAAVRDVGVFGPDAAATVARLTGLTESSLRQLGAYAHLTAEVHGQSALVARVPDLWLEGYEVVAPPAVVQQLHAEANALGVRTLTAEAWHVARVESGRPEWGIDMDDSTIPQEANLDALGAISYEKGCYTGQEVVARLHFRGHVNKRLVGLRTSGAPPVHGATLLDRDGKNVGDVRSVAVSPRLGGIALAMVRREIAVGDEIIAEHDDQRLPVQVCDLPFPAAAGE